MKQYQIRERVDIESDSPSDKLELYLHKLQPIHPVRIEEIPVKLDEITFDSQVSGTWNVQSIKFEQNPNREMTYRNLKLRERDCTKRINALRESISKEAFDRFLRKYRTDFRYRKFDGSFRKERIIIPVPTVSKLREIEKELKPSQYYKELAGVCQDSELRKQYYGLAEYFKDHPDLDRHSDKRRFVYRDRVIELASSNVSAMLNNNDNIAAFRLVPNFTVGTRRSYNWSAVYKQWSSRTQHARSQIETQLRLRDYYRRYLNNHSIQSRSDENRASQVSCVGQVSPTTFMEAWTCYTGHNGTETFLWDRSTIEIPGVAVNVPIVTRVASAAPAADPATLEVYTVKVDDLPEFPEVPADGERLRDLADLIKLRGIPAGACVFDEDNDGWTTAFPGYENFSDLRHRLVFHPANTAGCIQVRANREWVNGIPGPVGLSYSSQASIVRLNVGPDCSRLTHERLLNEIQEDVPIQVEMLGEEAPGALREQVELAHAKLRALDIPEHDKDAIFNLARSVGELKDLPLTCRTLRSLSRFLQEMGGRYAYIATTRSHSRDAIRLCLDNSADEWSRTIRSGQRIGSNFGYRSIQKSRIALLSYKHLCMAYLCWKFGISQTLADTETVARKGIRWCTTVQRGLRLLASKLDRRQPVHNVSVGWSKPLDVGMPHEKRAPRAKSGVRPFLMQSYDRQITNLRTARRTVTLTWTEGLVAYITGQKSDKLVYVDNGTAVVLDDQGFCLPMIPYGAPIRSTSTVRTMTSDAMRRIAKELSITRRVFTSQSIRGKVYGRWSIASLLKTVRKGGIVSKIFGFHPAEVMWELAPASFVLEWFTNLRSLVVAADRMIARAATATCQPIGKPWVAIASRLWAGCPEFSGSLLVQERFDQPIARLVRSVSEKTTENSSRIIRKQEQLDTVEFYYSRRTLEFTYSEPSSYKVKMAKTGIRKFLRHPLSGMGSLPPLRFRCNLNLGKLTSLLAMLTGK